MKVRGDQCLSDLLLDRWIAGESLAADERAHAEAHIQGCAACAGRREVLLREVREFDLPLRLPTPAPRPRWRFPLGLRVGFAAACAAAGVLLFLPSTEEPGIRTKGAASLSVIARTQEGTVARVLPGDTLAPGDAIRFEVRTTEPAVVAILGIDAAGAVTPYVEGVEVEAGGAQLLPGSILLDGTLGPERIVALFCEAPPGRAHLLEAGAEALKRAGGDPAAELRLEVPDCVQASLLMRKAERP